VITIRMTLMTAADAVISRQYVTNESHTPRSSCREVHLAKFLPATPESTNCLRPGLKAVRLDVQLRLAHRLPSLRLRKTDSENASLSARPARFRTDAADRRRRRE